MIQQINILILGSGGRENTLAWKIKQSSYCQSLYISPGNAGTDLIGSNVYLTDFSSIADFCIDNHIGLVVVGPEEPLVNGIVDFFNNHPILYKIPIIGPDQIGAQLEGSKQFSKKFMEKHHIPTAKAFYANAENMTDAIEYIKQMNNPIVVKADGLAAGKGVLICQSHQEAIDEIHAILTQSKFGKAGNKVLIEEFLDGIELSVFVLNDGENYLILPSAKDYKRIGEHDTGLNTGGMGAVSPVPFANHEFMKQVEESIIIPTVNGLKSENILYKGFIFIGLMNVQGKPYVIEYNCRLGDPETEVIIPKIENDLVELLLATYEQNLKHYKISERPGFCTTVMLTSKGYPESYEKDKLISGINEVKHALVFHAGTKTVDDQILTNGGRVMALTAWGNTLKEALNYSFEAANTISFEGKYFRRDIGNDLLS